MKWQYLTGYSEPTLRRGSLLKFEASYPFEDEVIMMVCEAPRGYDFAYGLITITGHKSGINMFVKFPADSINDDGLSTKWVEENFNLWVGPDTPIDRVYVRGPLNAFEI